MANWGIGLGGLAQGIERGIGIMDKLNGTPEEQRQRRVADANDEAKKEFDANGGGSIEEFQQKYLLPKVSAKMVAAGDLDGAKQWQNWATDENNRRATKDWGTGMLAAQSGDTLGAVKYFTSAARAKGYGGDYKVEDPEPLNDGGARLKITAPDGRSIIKEFKTPDEALKFGSIINPEAAFSDWRTQQADSQKRAADVADYGKKKKIDVATKADEAPIDVATYGAKRKIDTQEETNRTDNFLERYQGQKQIDLSVERQRDELGLGKGKGEHDPAEVKIAKWLIDNKIASSPEDAWNKVRHSKENPEALRAQIFARALTPQQGQKNYEAFLRAGQTPNPPGITGPSASAPATAAPAAAPPVRQPAPAAQRPDQMTPGNGNKPQPIALPTPPPGVPPGSGYSPSTGMWFTRDGQRFDKNGQPVAVE